MKDTLRRLRGLEKEANAQLRDASGEIVAQELPRIQSAMRSDSKQSRLVAGSVKIRRDRVPKLVAGGRGWVSSSSGRARAGDVFFGAEFGGGAKPTTQQFRPHRGRQGYAFWPTIRADGDQIAEQWIEAVDNLLKEWGRG